MGQFGRRGRDQKLEELASQPWAAGTTAEDRRWLGAVSDEVRVGPGAVVAREARSARWVFVVMAGRVEAGPASADAGRCVTPVGGDVVAATAALVLAVPAHDEAELRRRFPALQPAPTRPRTAPAVHCPIAAVLGRS